MDQVQIIRSQHYIVQSGDRRIFDMSTLDYRQHLLSNSRHCWQILKSHTMYDNWSLPIDQTLNSKIRAEHTSDAAVV